MVAEQAHGVETVLTRMAQTLAPMESSGDSRRHFLATYARTTRAVGEAIRQARFEDPAWVDRWDVAFAQLYVDALDAHTADPASAPRPWRVAFDAEPSLPPLRHVLLGINAHINFDLPQALLAVITDEQFDDQRVIARRRRDHERIDGVLTSRVAAEDAALEVASGRQTFDRLLQPLNRAASKRFLREARRKVWHNTAELQRARVAGAQEYAQRLAELEVLSAARVADIVASRQVLLRLSVAGFGVLLPP
jgi:hypothetical protein